MIPFLCDTLKLYHELFSILLLCKQMVSTRSERDAQLFDGTTWARLLDAGFADSLGSICLIFHDLRSVGVFNAVIVQLARKMYNKYGDDVTLNKVKRRVEELRSRYNSFKQFLDLPGVHYTPYHERVTVKETYWANVNQNGGVSSFVDDYNCLPLYYSNRI